MDTSAQPPVRCVLKRVRSDIMEYNCSVDTFRGLRIINLYHGVSSKSQGSHKLTVRKGEGENEERGGEGKEEDAGMRKGESEGEREKERGREEGRKRRRGGRGGCEDEKGGEMEENVRERGEEGRIREREREG